MAAILKADIIGNKTDSTSNLTIQSSGAVTVGGAITVTSGTVNGVTIGGTSPQAGSFTNVTATNIQATSGQPLAIKEDNGSTVISVDTSGNVTIDPATTLTIGEAGDNTVSGTPSGAGQDRHTGQTIELQGKVSGVGYQSGSTSSSAARGVGVMYAGITGEIRMYGGLYAPEGWVLCDGSAYTGTPGTIYKNLFDVIGTYYGNGASGGTGEFNVPDMRGRITMGAGAGVGGGAEDSDGSSKPAGGSALTARSLGEWGGEESHILTEAEMPQHNHGASGSASGTQSISEGNHQHQYTNDDTPNYGEIVRIQSSIFDYDARSTGGTTNGLFRTSSAGGWSKTIDFSNASISVSTNNTGSGSPHNVLQPYICVNYIIKL